jgi:hypothetical protein
VSARPILGDVAGRGTKMRQESPLDLLLLRSLGHSQENGFLRLWLLPLTDRQGNILSP